MRILIIEDNEEINDILKEAVTGAGYEAIQSFSGSEGMLRFTPEDFDMVLFPFEEITLSQLPQIAFSANSAFSLWTS